MSVVRTRSLSSKSKLLSACTRRNSSRTCACEIRKELRGTFLIVCGVTRSSKFVGKLTSEGVYSLILFWLSTSDRDFMRFLGHTLISLVCDKGLCYAGNFCIIHQASLSAALSSRRVVPSSALEFGAAYDSHAPVYGKSTCSILYCCSWSSILYFWPKALLSLLTVDRLYFPEIATLLSQRSLGMSLRQ